MNRCVLFDTETTGFDPLTGDRVIEIAAIELINDLPTDNQFHVCWTRSATSRPTARKSTASPTPMLKANRNSPTSSSHAGILRRRAAGRA